MPPSSSKDALSPKTRLRLLVRRSAPAHEEPPSPAADSSAPRQLEIAMAATDKVAGRLEVYNEVLARLRAAGGTKISPAFEDALWAHFHRLPAR
ncbi:hypothetical protein ZWY2020_020229 [Hordeum vulgare]|nr:hypothetical protein ZWY2020_020229 [Hordeum vulgare]